METIILAAGESKRMGQDKALLDFRERPLLAYLIDKLSPLSTSLHIVLGKNGEEIESAVKQHIDPDPRFHFVENKNWQEGMFSSILTGMRSVSGKYLILLQMIDQPFLPQSFYRDLIFNIDEKHLVFQPALLKEDVILPGHPLLFKPEFREIIFQNEDLNNLREILQLYDSERKFFITAEKRIRQNLNFYEQYRQELRNMENGNPG